MRVVFCDTIFRQRRVVVVEGHGGSGNHCDLALSITWQSTVGCDLVKMKVVDVMAYGQIKRRASVLQSKTQNLCASIYLKGRVRRWKRGWETTSWSDLSTCGQGVSMSACISRRAIPDIRRVCYLVEVPNSQIANKAGICPQELMSAH